MVSEINNKIKESVQKFLEVSKNKEIQIISPFDTDGITSATIMIKTLKKLDKTFSIKIIKNLEREMVYSLPKNKITIFLDLASGSLNHISNTELENVFIIDHHKINQDIPKNVTIINPELHDKQKISSSGLTYLFCKEIDKENKEFAKLAILGMIGDSLDKEISKLNNGILNDSEIKIKHGAKIYPSTRPLNCALEYNSSPFIPGVTGNVKGVLELLRDANINPKQKGYPSLLELNKEEMEKLVTAITLRIPKSNSEEIVGDIYLLKFYNKLEDAREISSKINACSKINNPNIALQFCMEIPTAKQKSEAIYVKYRQHIVSALKFIEKTEKIQGKGYMIVNTKENIKPTIIETAASIISKSKVYDNGTAIVAIAYEESKIKISAHRVGDSGRNVKQLLTETTTKFQTEVNGHEFAAGALIDKQHEEPFLKELKKNLEIEIVRV